MNKLIVFYLSAVALLVAATVVLVTGCGKGSSQPAAGAPGRPGGGGGTPVEAVIVRPQPLDNTIFSTGTLLANEEVELRSEISGRVTGVFFDEGARVTNGQLLVKINDQELQAQLKRKELEEKLAGDEERRQRELYEIKAISQEEYDQTNNRYKMIQAEREVIKSQIAKTEIRAPFDGYIGLRYVSAGGFISPSMLAATMQDIDPIKVEFSVPERHARQIKSGTMIFAQVGDAAVDTGRVYAVESKIDPSTRTIKARAFVANPGERNIPGSFARIEIKLERLADAIVVPAESIIPELSGNKVFVADNGKARAVPVTTGIRLEKSIQIVDGLRAGDTLITTGLLQLADGRAVQVRKILNP